MNVASLSLCKELYELSRWKVPIETTSLNPADIPAYYDNGKYICPAYTLGYLLRKLPKNSVMLVADDERLKSTPMAAYDNYRFTADILEDVACKLAIELFKQGVLK